MRSRFACTVCSALGCALLCLAGYAAAAPREWTDATGTFKAEGELISYDGKVAVLDFGEGKGLKIPVDRLSAADIAYLKKTYPQGFNNKPKAAAKKATGPMKIDVIGLSIVRPLETPETSPGAVPNLMALSAGPPGTRIVLRLPDSGQNIIGIDSQLSKITSCIDDKKTDLTQGSTSQPTPALGGPLAYTAGPTGQGGMIIVSQPQIPAAGASKIRLVGELHVICGDGEKTDELPEVALAAGTQIDTPLPITFQQVVPQNLGETKLLLTMQSAEPLSRIKNFVFLNASGGEIATQLFGDASMAAGGQPTYIRSIGLAEAVDKASLRIVSYESTETVKVPLSVTFGIGL
jgi:hypothetical protein